jgi:hypothetical protein
MPALLASAHRRPARELLLGALYVSLIAYLIYGTGIVSDDYTDIVRHRNARWFEALVPRGNLINVPAFNLMRMPFYVLSSPDRVLPIEMAKIVYAVASFYMLSRFFSLFLGPDAAMTTALLFLFFPSHESTVFWLAGQYLTLTTALYCYAYFEVRGGRWAAAAVLATVASFTSYASTAVAGSLFALCALQGLYRQGLVLLLPNVAYAAYYVIISKVMAVTISRLPSTWTVSGLLDQFLVQVGSFLDATVGPSFWLKVYYSVRENDTTSGMVGIAVLIACGAIARYGAPIAHGGVAVPRALLAALVLLTFANLAMFSVTGSYPQLAFNLGNRVTTFGTLGLAYALVALPVPRAFRYGALGLLLFAALGMSAHWKAWQTQQAAVIDRIRHNTDLAAYQGPLPVYVSGNQYSRLGPFSNIEFLSESWVVDAIFEMATAGRVTASPLNKRLVEDGGELWDRKYRTRHRLGPEVAIYDSEADRLYRVPSRALNGEIARLRDEQRHWAQMIADERLRAWIVRLMPRLQYAF